VFYIGLDQWMFDAGDIKGKEYLPVKQLRFGDTGTALDEKRGRYTLGALMCEGDGNIKVTQINKQPNFVYKLTSYIFLFYLQIYLVT